MTPKLSITLLALTTFAACAEQDLSDEDAAADAAASGKSDAYGFPTGAYASFGGQGEPREVINAVFHENGQLDLTWGTGDYESAYVTGSYKVYRYAQRDRIRFTDENGRVLLRADWVSTDGQLEIDGKSLYPDRARPENILDCLAMLVHDTNLFEEGFTEYEYPDLSLSKAGTSYFLELGTGNIDAAFWDTVTVDVGASELTLDATLTEDTGGGKLTMRVPNAAPRRGEIRYTEEGARQSTLMASIVCY